MYDTVSHDFHYPHMANDVYPRVRDCAVCAGPTQPTTNKEIVVFLHLADHCIKWPSTYLVRREKKVPKPAHGPDNILVLKTAKALPSDLTTATAVATILFDYLISNSGTPLAILTDNGPQLSSKSFQAISTESQIMSLTQMEYHPHTNPDGAIPRNSLFPAPSLCS